MHHYHHNMHWVRKILALLVWVAGLAFLYTGWQDTILWNHGALFYAWAVVVLSLMAFMAKHCDYGWHKKMGMGAQGCSHESGCKCGDCPKCM